MVDNPITNQISNPGVSPIQPTPGPERPSIGAEETGKEKPFALSPQGSPTAPQATTKLPSPMEVAGDSARQQPQVAPEELSEQITKLKDDFGVVQGKLQNGQFSKNLAPDHFEALQRLTQKLSPDMQTIAKSSKGEFNPGKTGSEGGSALERVTQWLSGSQETLGGALNYLQTTEKPNVADYLKLQYAVQRATQRGELFASIIGSSVSGIKTLMSTQLG